MARAAQLIDGAWRIVEELDLRTSTTTLPHRPDRHVISSGAGKLSMSRVDDFISARPRTAGLASAKPATGRRYRHDWVVADTVKYQYVCTPQPVYWPLGPTWVALVTSVPLAPQVGGVAAGE